MRHYVVSIPVATLALLAGCASPTTANKANFAKAINAALAKQCIMVNPRATMDMSSATYQYPLGVKIDQPDTGPLSMQTKAQAQVEADKTNAQRFAPYKALVAAGLLTASKGTVSDPIFHKKQVPGVTYTLTPAGKKALRDPKHTAFCAGHWEVGKIIDFTQPGEVPTGMTMSRVNFTYAAASVPTWTKAAIKAGYPDLKQELGQQGKGIAHLILMNNGWKAEVSTLNATH